LIRKAGHRAANTDAADVRTSADTCHPTPFRNIAVHYRTPATHFDEALGSAISVRELSLLVITASIASFVHRCPEEPLGPELIVKRDHGRASRHLIKQIEQRLHEVVGLHRTAWDIYNGQPRFGLPVPAQI